MSDPTQRLDDLAVWAIQRARRGLAHQAPAIEAALQGTQAHGDQTGATRAGYRAYVVGRGETGAATIAAAVAAVEAKNPGASATAPGQLPPGALGVVLTCPTVYQRHLEVENAGQKAALAPTLQASTRRLTRAAAEGE